MFKRRKPLRLHQYAKQFFWPSMGWARTISYVKHRLIRVSDPTHKIALGLAIGMGISFTPLLGTHFIQAALLALILRANILSAIIGTFIGNPWTFPFFWWAGLSFGSFLFSFLGLNGANDLPEHMSPAILMDTIWNDPATLFLPWMLGGYILAFIAIPISYAAFYFLVNGAKSARAKSIAKRKKPQEEKTEPK